MRRRCVVTGDRRLKAFPPSIPSCLESRCRFFLHLTIKLLLESRFLHALAAPDVLHQAVPLRQSVDGIVALTHSTDEAAQSVDVVLSGDCAAVLVNLGDGDLDGTVVFGLDDAVGGAALARDVAVMPTLVSLFLSYAYCSSSPRILTGRRYHHGRSPF
jgi:hypothetical protein